LVAFGVEDNSFFSHEDFFPNLPLNFSLLKYLEAMAFHFSTIPFPHVHTKCHRYISFVLHYIEDEVVE
jgi:hypothetical protein